MHVQISNKYEPNISLKLKCSRTILVRSLCPRVIFCLCHYAKPKRLFLRMSKTIFQNVRYILIECPRRSIKEMISHCLSQVHIQRTMLRLINLWEWEIYANNKVELSTICTLIIESNYGMQLWCTQMERSKSKVEAPCLAQRRN